MESLASERINAPVVACGIGNETDAAVEAIKAGAKEYVPLPPDPELIAAILEAATEETGAIIHGPGPMEKVLSLADQIAPSETPNELLVVSVNLGVGLAEPDDIRALLTRHPGDIVLLQELTTGVAARLASDLATEYPYRVFHPGGVNGRGILSRTRSSMTSCSCSKRADRTCAARSTSAGRESRCSTFISRRHWAYLV